MNDPGDNATADRFLVACCTPGGRIEAIRDRRGSPLSFADVYLAHAVAAILAAHNFAPAIGVLPLTADDYTTFLQSDEEAHAAVIDLLAHAEERREATSMAAARN